MFFKLGPAIKQYAIVAIANFTFLHISLSISWLSPAMVILRDVNQTILPEPLTEYQMSWILSISELVAIFAFFFCGYLADNLGRKNSILLACLPRLCTCILLFISSQVWMLLLGRAIIGLSDALIVTVVALYVSEIASKEIRGGLASGAQIWSSFGTVTVLSIGPFISYNMLNLLVTTIIILTSIPLLFLPKSPYFLYRKGHLEEAVKLLTSLRGSKALAFDEIAEYKKTNHKTNKMELLKDKSVLKSICKVMFLAMCSQMTGNTYIILHLQTIFELTNTSVNSAVSSLIIGFTSTFAACCTIYSSDRFGKKPVIMLSLIGQAVGMVGLGIFFWLTQANFKITGFLNYLPLISMMLSIYCYSAGLGALIWILCAELFDGPIRAFGVSSAVFIACIFGFLTVRYLTALMNVIGEASTYLMFAGVCVVTCIYIQLFIPETKGKTFSQIQDDLKCKA